MAKALTRSLSFFNQWAAEVWRQPWLMVVLILGPFLVLFLFGYGERVTAPRPRTIIVTSSGQSSTSGGPMAIAPQELTQYLQIEQTTSDLTAARQALVDGRADLVVVIPSDPTTAIQQGQQVPIQVLTNEIDPVRLSYSQSYIRQEVDALNRQTVEKAISQAQGQVGDVSGFISQADQYLQLLRSGPDLSQSAADLQQLQTSLDQLSTTLHRAQTVAGANPLFAFAGLAQPLDQLRQATQAVDNLRQQVSQLRTQLQNVGTPPSPQQIQQLQTSLDQAGQTAKQLQNTPAGVLAAPFSLNLKNVAPWTPNGTGFYAPAVLVLILQHVGITLGALSMSRIRMLRMTELFQTAPVRSLELAVGNYLSYGALCCIVGGALLGLIVGVLGVPVFGPPAALAGALIVLVVAAVGIGLVVSMLSSSEQQAAQVAMLILIASVFFSGFLVALDTITWPIRIVSYLLPATYAIQALDDVMLRGVFREPWDLAVLAGFAVFFFAASVLLFKRELRPR